jgi:kynurenine formamidase
MGSKLGGIATIGVGVALLLAAGMALAQEPSTKPFDENWWPTEWGADDKVGAPNRTNPEIVLKAITLVKQGKTATLGKLYASDIPLLSVRDWQMTIPGTPTGGPVGVNQLVFHDELVTAQLGQVGTQFDGPGHIGVRTPKGDLFYNGRNAQDTYERTPLGYVTGLGDLGVEYVAEKGFVCRGVLLDAAAYKGMNPLPIPTSPDSPGIISADDVKGMIKKQGIADIGEGDCVFLYTGHGDLWKNSEWKSLSAEVKAERVAKFNAGEPGFGLSACEYMASRKIILTGGDTSANDAQPVTDVKDAVVPCHTEMQARRGIWNIENLDFEPLLKDKVYEFLFVWAPLKMVGATGSPGNPMVLY